MEKKVIRQYRVFQKGLYWHISGGKKETTHGIRQLRRQFGNYASREEALMACQDNAMKYIRNYAAKRFDQFECIENMDIEITEDGVDILSWEEFE